MRLRASAAPGLEAVVAGELAAAGLAAAPKYLRPGARAQGLTFEGGLLSLYAACLRLRTAERVSVELGRFQAGSFPELESAAGKLPWDELLPKEAAVDVRARCRRSKLSHEKGVAERVARACGRPAALEGAAQRVEVSVDGDEVVVELDACGEPLHRRGYRLETAKAPIRETLAAALLLASAWDPGTPLLDPFCGSGTIPIEAAMLARGTAPGRARRFAFMDWAGFDAGAWKRLVEESAAREKKDVPLIAGSDRDDGAVAASKANAERAGVAVSFARAAVSAAEPPPGVGAVVANPPYGGRLEGRGDPRDVYAQLGKLVLARCAGAKVALVTSDESLARATGLSLTPGPSTKNGGLDVRFWLSRA